MKPSALVILVLAMLAAATAPPGAIAQSMIPEYLGVPLGFPLPDEYFLNPAVGEVVEAAFAQPYGQVLVNEFAAVIIESGDPACVKERGIDTSKLADRARAILISKGTQMYQITAAAIDRPRYETILAQRMGAKASAELAYLRADPVVQQYVAIGRPAKLVNVAFKVVFELDRYSWMNRIKLVRPLVFNVEASDALDRADPRDKTPERLSEFIENNKSQALMRYIELHKASRDALKDAIRWDEMRQSGPNNWMAGLDEDLAGLCVKH